MRSVVLIVALCLAMPSLAGCSKEQEQYNAFAFKPPTAMPRKDFVESLGRRFNRSDRDHNGVLEVSDFPKRPEALARWDTDGDGMVTREEYRAASIARFDASDTDKDNVLTSLERTQANGNDAESDTAPGRNVTE